VGILLGIGVIVIDDFVSKRLNEQSEEVNYCVCSAMMLRSTIEIQASRREERERWGQREGQYVGEVLTGSLQVELDVHSVIERAVHPRKATLRPYFLQL
jgi:hypothetical protein